MSLVRSPLWRLDLGPSVGLPVVRQSTQGQLSSSFGFGYSGVGVLSLRLEERAYLSLSLEGGGEVFKLDGQRTSRATGNALLGGLMAF